MFLWFEHFCVFFVVSCLFSCVLLRVCCTGLLVSVGRLVDWLIDWRSVCLCLCINVLALFAGVPRVVSRRALLFQPVRPERGERAGERAHGRGPCGEPDDLARAGATMHRGKREGPESERKGVGAGWAIK